MRTHPLARLARMGPAEATWRGRRLAGEIAGSIRWRLRRPAWNRRTLLHILSSDAPVDARLAARRGHWERAHQALAEHFAARPSRFVIHPLHRGAVRRRIVTTCPEAMRDARLRADRIVAGEYDLLGYRALRFQARDLRGSRTRSHEHVGLARRHSTKGENQPSIDWHLDPVHGRRVPLRFWAQVPFLDPSCGDHKIIWELNRHQHWIMLGRAWWLTENERYRERFLIELQSWIDANPPLTGINWASMLEIAFRSISWTWALHMFARAEAGDSPWTVDLLLALDRQLAHVEQNLSYYFSPNTHLLGEALALYVTGRALPELAASRRRCALGRRILISQIARQIASDGGHCERSTHYHRYALDFYLLALVVARVTADAVATEFESVVRRLAVAARLLADDCGRLPHIGDDDGGVLLPLTGRAADDVRDSLATASVLVDRPGLRIGDVPEETLWLLSHPAVWSAAGMDPELAPSIPGGDAPSSAALPDTGYYVSRSTRGDHLVIDGGPHGYENGGHAHADALSFTLSVGGVPLLIDAGTGCYTVAPEVRDRFRSTALHNTLVLNQRPQSIPSGPFHWFSTASARISRWRTNGAFDYFDASHDGYLPAEHRRRILVLHGDILVVGDLVTGPGPHAAAVHWHFDPRWTVHAAGRMVTATSRGARVELAIPQGVAETFTGDETTGLGWHAPVYGRIEATTTVRISHHGSPCWIVSVFGLSADNDVRDVETLPVWAEAGMLAQVTAVRLGRARSTDYVLFAEPAREGATATWRVADFETDARMLYCRADERERITRLAIVDGSVVRRVSTGQVQLAAGQVVPDMHVDSNGIRSSQPFDRVEVHLAGPV